MKRKMPLFLTLILLTFICLNAQIVKGKKVSVHKIDQEFGQFKGNYGYTYGENGKFSENLKTGEHSIEFLPWYGEQNEYKLKFIAEKDKTYEILKGENNLPVLIDSKTKKTVVTAEIVSYQLVDAKNNFKLFTENLEKKDLAVLILEPEKYDIIPIIYKIDETWGGISASSMKRFNGFKYTGGSLMGAVKNMSFTIELLPGNHILYYSLHSNKIKFTMKDGLTTGENSYQIYPLSFYFEAGKTYTFKFKDENDPETLLIVQKE